jgi:hypothetical protein
MKPMNYTGRKFKLMYVMMFIIVCLVIISVANITQDSLLNDERVQASNALQAIGQLKSNQLSSWVKQQQANAIILQNNELFAKAVHNLQLNESTELKNILLNLMIDLKENYQYLSILITDASGNCTPSAPCGPTSLIV